jgi:DNA-binding response OmpR family regulator
MVVDVGPRPDEARRALVLHDRQLVIDLIELTLNHGLFVVRAASSLGDAEAILAGWRPHMAVLDMDHDDSTALLQRLGASNTLRQTSIPVLGLTRRGDLRTKLRAFDLGVDDILTMPFSPEELLARSIVISRRVSGTTLPIVPTIRLGEMEIDILNREVRAEVLGPALLKQLERADRGELVETFTRIHETLRRDASTRAAEAIVALMEKRA